LSLDLFKKLKTLDHFLIITDLKNTTANSDGLIKCLRQRQDRFVINPYIYAFKFCSIYKMLWHPDSFIYLDSIIGAVGRRAGALFFARHQDYFVVTCNFTAVYLDLVPFRSFTVTPSSLPSTGTGKKLGTATPRRSVAGSRHLIKPPGRWVQGIEGNRVLVLVPLQLFSISSQTDSLFVL